MIKIFISYSHVDEPFRKELEKHLSALRRNGLISTWTDRQIIAGEMWDNKINAALLDAKIILLLISSDFLYSDYSINVELTTALERHRSKEAVVIPVILRYCDWSSAPFAFLQGLPSDGKPLKAWEDLDKGLYNVIEGVKLVIQKILLGNREDIKFGINPEAQISELRKRSLMALSQRDIRRLLFDIKEFKAGHISNFEVEELEGSVLQMLDFDKKQEEIKNYANPRRWSPVARMAIMASALILIVTLSWFLYIPDKPMKPENLAVLSPEGVFEGDTIMIRGNNIPYNSSRIKVLFFDSVEGKVLYSSNSVMQVEIPRLNDQYNRMLQLKVILNGDTTSLTSSSIVRRSPLLNNRRGQYAPDESAKDLYVLDDSIKKTNYIAINKNKPHPVDKLTPMIPPLPPSQHPATPPLENTIDTAARIEVPTETPTKRTRVISALQWEEALLDVSSGKKTVQDFEEYLCENLQVIVFYDNKIYTFTEFCYEIKGKRKKIKKITVKDIKIANNCVFSMQVAVRWKLFTF